MPFQNIVVPRTSEGADPESGLPSTVVHETFGLRLQWGRDTSSVQIASCKMYPAHPHGPWMPKEEDLHGWDDAEAPALWATLDRARINELIKHLRAARDQAFGKDE